MRSTCMQKKRPPWNSWLISTLPPIRGHLGHPLEPPLKPRSWKHPSPGGTTQVMAGTSLKTCDCQDRDRDRIGKVSDPFFPGSRIESEKLKQIGIGIALFSQNSFPIPINFFDLSLQIFFNKSCPK